MVELLQIIEAKVQSGFYYILFILLVVLITLFTARLLNKSLIKFFEKSSRLLKVDTTRYAFTRHLSVAGVYLIGIGVIIYGIPQLRALSVTLFAGAGILAIVIGFASQQAFANIVGGIFIIIFKPFKVGDWINIDNDTFGVVEDITLRHTVIRNPENKRYVVPNSLISEKKIENADIADKRICKLIEIGISYDSDIDKAIAIMRDEALSHPFCIDSRSKEEKSKNIPVVNVLVINLGDSSVDLRAWVWAADRASGFTLKCDLLKSIKQRFDREGIEIPFPHRTIVQKQVKRR